jgi:hypothetical protein
MPSPAMRIVMVEPPNWRLRNNDDKTPILVGILNGLLLVVRVCVNFVVAMVRAIFSN